MGGMGFIPDLFLMMMINIDYRIPYCILYVNIKYMS